MTVTTAIRPRATSTAAPASATATTTAVSAGAGTGGGGGGVGARGAMAGSVSGFSLLCLDATVVSAALAGARVVSRPVSASYAAATSSGP